jgi:hypothetical protein
MTTNSQHRPGSRSRIALVLATTLTACGVLAAASPGTHASATKAAASAYGWPVKPFDQPHPVRGSFGDPRTIFSGPPSARTLLSGAASVQFHSGIDVSAPDGTPVYPVASGTVVRVDRTKDVVTVDTGAGRAFEYWHITPAVTIGSGVEADVTVLGRIIREAGHVHLTELHDGAPVNPLAPGHLVPYADHTVPRIDYVGFRRGVVSPDLMPGFVTGRVEIVASAYDMPALHVTGPWHDLPVTPARVVWQIRSATTHRVVVPAHVAYDVREALPSTDSFWRIYARGTHQNMCVFEHHYSYMQPGDYLFRLAPGGFDTRALRDGAYELVIAASDVRGNRTTSVTRFGVYNGGL